MTGTLRVRSLERRRRAMRLPVSVGPSSSENVMSLAVVEPVFGRSSMIAGERIPVLKFVEV